LVSHFSSAPWRRPRQKVVVHTKEAAAPGTARQDALRLLRLLQEEARFVDFVREDIDNTTMPRSAAALNPRQMPQGPRGRIT
jgi:hypothetical protein